MVDSFSIPSRLSLSNLPPPQYEFVIVTKIVVLAPLQVYVHQEIQATRVKVAQQRQR